MSLRSHPLLDSFRNVTFSERASSAGSLASLGGEGELQEPLLDRGASASGEPPALGTAASGELPRLQATGSSELPAQPPARQGSGGAHSRQGSVGGASRGRSRLGTPPALPPLLPAHSSVVEDAPSSSKGSGPLASTVILAKTIMGAGMAALPRAFVMLGLLMAGAFLLTMGYMTHWSIEALTLGTVVTGHMSYPQVVRALCGRTGSLLLQLSLVFRCAGLMVVYLIVSADILAGHEGAPGLVCDLLGAPPQGACGNRQLAAGLVAALCIAPLVAPKRLASTTITSWIGLVACGVWAAVTLLLAVVAAIRGMAFRPHWLPDLEAFSGGGSAQLVTQLCAVIPILATAYTCQMTVHHILRDLKPFSERRAAATSASAVALTTTIFLTVAVGSQVAFGPKVPADVLVLFNGEQLEPLVGAAAARALYVAVRLGFLASIITIFPMQMAPYKESLARLLVGTELSGAPYFLLTYASLALFYFVAMHAGSIWVPLQFVGATAGVLIAFVFPAWIALSALRRRDPAALPARRYWAWNAWALLAIGALQFASTMASMFLSPPKGGDHGGPSHGGGGGGDGGGLGLLAFLL